MLKIKTSHKKMQEDKRKIVNKYLKEYQKRFKLNDIKFRVGYVRGNKVADFYAEIVIRGNAVRINFNEDLMEQKPQEIQDTVVHELLHVVFYKIMSKMLCVAAENVKKEASYTRVENKLCKLEHEIIEKLVHALLAQTSIK